ncbi:MAG: siroheme synthase [Flavobacteriales bacterium CG_4_9_14_0_2_um_filter_35_242]|nr:bifunctional precorrin-2 dehydrogenase/sirohydrochlorin ferrochelatase [Zetaproteobacteria bacterium]OIO12196.1 MAG: siroheme synthase [Flavobacteriaceae bacterium CG1_02_35_72]PIV18527.1 MAG: siroheme synthase [Flavobacteriales bacterium CG03_land_8_20_14_0_80_35_15]PIX07693.1 MAG: siroheme synthase [Flavobacteriales bacterium CG_4_8_14_3_um_filter_35_10]PJA06034.1 MAG: siroheme synthase [Flavobacteriales bacterium CG_4_10_14_0_2_um_filter_35_18]PJC59065.1 MAG: siroheme synthase [Flavobact
MEKNELYPIFLKVSKLQILIVGGGAVGLEKLRFLLKSSPNANVIVLSINFLPALIALAKKHQIQLIEAPYHKSFLKERPIVIAATDSNAVNIQVYNDCKQRNILVNVADNPPYCDFFMGGIVTKGNIKIAISTNGKSPILAKRLRQFFEQVLPDDINELSKNINTYRKSTLGIFSEKVKALNQLTKSLLVK